MKVKKKQVTSMMLTKNRYRLMALSYLTTSILGILLRRKCWMACPVKQMEQQRKKESEQSSGMKMKLSSRLSTPKQVSAIRKARLIRYHFSRLLSSGVSSIIFNLNLGYLLQSKFIAMKVRVATSNDKELLGQIKEALLSKWVSSKANTQQSCRLFDEKVSRSGDEYIYSALINQEGEVVLVAALYLEYKLTRGLSQIYHLEIEYKRCSREDELFFQSEVIKMIPGYKITGLHVTESQYFPPHQVYMEIELHRSARVKGSL